MNAADTYSSPLVSAFARKREEAVIRSLRPPNLAKCTRSEIWDYFENSYELYETLFSALTCEEHFYKSPDRLRLPLVFYLAHTATLHVNKMMLAGLITERVNRHFETLFETGVNEMSWDDTENYRLGGAFKWPSLHEVLEYRRQVHHMVIKVIETAPLELPITQDHPWWAIIMGIEHERIHFETSSVLLRQLPVEYLKCPENWKYSPVSSDEPAGENTMIRVKGRKIEFGKPWDHPTFGWDNEYGRAVMNVPTFEASKYKVTNGEFLEFVKSGGYQNRELWTDEGWMWCQSRQAKHPTFWVCDEGCKSGCGSVLATYSHCNISCNGISESDRTTKYKYRAIYDVIPMPFDWPVDVNYHEAKAYCRWKGPEYRLPTEAETNCIRGDESITSAYECDPFCTGKQAANNNLTYGSSTPVNHFPPNHLGFYDTHGNVWEYIEDQYNGLPGFKTHYLYDDFSTSSFSGQYTMMLGGSWASTGGQGQQFYRLGFRRHFFQHLGFRLARSVTRKPTPVRLCKASTFVLGLGVPANPVAIPLRVTKENWVATSNEQDKFDQFEICKKLLTTEVGEIIDYGRPLVNFCIKVMKRQTGSTSTAIVFGCAGGYTSFCLSAECKQVVGVDYSGRLIDAALQFQDKREVDWMDGDTLWSLKLPEEVKGVPEFVVFKQLTWIPNEIAGYDLVLFEFLDRLMEPRSWLLKLWECVRSRGVVVFSASDQWTAGTIQKYIGEWFDLLEETHICNKRVSAWQLKPRQ